MAAERSRHPSSQIPALLGWGRWEDGAVHGQEGEAAGWDTGVQGSILTWGGHRLVSRLPLPGLNPDPFSHSEQPCALPAAAHQPPGNTKN